ncbi:MAG: hypothetical protein IKE46_12130 [Selenomonadaceae bacterium]|nr:hypothetical protein [Selenomonadaceae bacterium]
MNERGFVTVFALCLILVIALIVKGIQESDTNHNYAAADFQTEFDLQNAADGGIYEAAELVRSGQRDLPANNVPVQSIRKNYQKELVNRSTKTERGTIRVTVWGERLKIQGYRRSYPSYKKNLQGTPKYGYVLFSVAQLDSARTNGKIYRRAFAYVVDGKGMNDLGRNVEEPVAPEDKDVVHFMELPFGKDR